MSELVTKQEFIDRYPYGDIKVLGIHIYSRLRFEGGTPLCMRCGHSLEDMSKFKLVNGAWVPRKSNPSMRQYVCFECEPEGQVTSLSVGTVFRID